MARALDDAAADRQPLRLEAQERRLDVVRGERIGQRGGVVAGLRHAGADMRPRDEGRVADRCATRPNAMRGVSRS